MPCIQSTSCPEFEYMAVWYGIAPSKRSFSGTRYFCMTANIACLLYMGLSSALPSA